MSGRDESLGSLVRKCGRIPRRRAEPAAIGIVRSNRVIFAVARAGRRPGPGRGRLRLRSDLNMVPVVGGLIIFQFS